MKLTGSLSVKFAVATGDNEDTHGVIMDLSYSDNDQKILKFNILVVATRIVNTCYHIVYLKKTDC